MNGIGRGEIRSGRVRSRVKTAGELKKTKTFSEPVLFTFGIVFVILYFAGLLLSSGAPQAPYGPEDTVAVMAVEDEEGKEISEKGGKGIWDMLEDCLRDVLGAEGE